MNRCFSPDCHHNAPYGFRRAGPRSFAPKGKGGYLWACEAHLEEARARKEKAEA